MMTVRHAPEFFVMPQLCYSFSHKFFLQTRNMWVCSVFLVVGRDCVFGDDDVITEATVTPII
jgi:hypothetical protein